MRTRSSKTARRAFFTLLLERCRAPQQLASLTPARAQGGPNAHIAENSARFTARVRDWSSCTFGTSAGAFVKAPRLPA
jgi:hypothetical protein